MRLDLPTLLRLGALSPAPGGAAAPPAVPQATHWRQPSAADAEFLQASSVPYAGVAGTIIAPVNLTGIGSSRGGILHLTDAAESAYLAIIPGSPDVLRGYLDIGGTPTTVDVAYSADDNDLYDGFPKVAWMRWTNGGTLEVGWNDPAGSLNDSASCGASLAGGTATVSVGNSGGSGGSIGGEFEAALFDRVLSNAEIQGVLAASTLRNLAPGDAVLYPRPADGVVEDDLITTPATQVVDEAAYTYTIITTDGLSPLQAAGDISDVGRFIGAITMPQNVHVGETVEVVVEVRGTGSYSLAYQWHLAGADVPGATTTTSPAPIVSQEGETLGCRVSITSGGSAQVVEAPTCQVYCYGLSNAAVTSDYVTSSATVAPEAGMTLISFTGVTSIGGSRGPLLMWGLGYDAGTAGNNGVGMQINPTGPQLTGLFSRAGTTSGTTVNASIPGTSTDGVRHLRWASVSADGLTGRAGVDASASSSVTITGGIDTGAAGLAATNQRPVPSLRTAARGIVAVLNRAWSDAEAAAIWNAANPREALITFLLAERALGNVLWWPVSRVPPTLDIETTADLADAGNASAGVVLASGSSRVVSEGP